MTVKANDLQGAKGSGTFMPQSHYPDSPDTVRSLMTQSLRGEISI